MDSKALKVLLSGKKYLLLQGPMGPFFSELNQWLELYEREVVSIVFNGGDKWYLRKRQHRVYKQTPQEFPKWLEGTWKEYDFDTIVCFGDCRPFHQEAKRWAQLKGIKYLAFEEGYLRPHFITLEKNGVNAFSELPRNADFYRNLPSIAMPDIDAIIPSCWSRVRHAMMYYLAGWYYRYDFPTYRHHKSFSIWYESRCWFRAAWRKILYGFQQRNVLYLLQTNLDQRYYLAILQVYNDSQIYNHSPYNDIREYVNEVIHSFANNGPSTDFLIFKHHPMDRGHRFYGSLIRKLGEKYRISHRIIYVHDLPMPELLAHAKSVVTINSTAGISALIHSKPLKVMGNALYDIKGLTYQGHLNEFWNADFKPDMKLFNQFRVYLLTQTQINTVFYSRRRKSLMSFLEGER